MFVSFRSPSSETVFGLYGLVVLALRMLLKTDEREIEALIQVTGQTSQNSHAQVLHLRVI